MTNLPFPKAVLDQHFVVLGKTRSGKSSTLRVPVEWLLDRNEPVGIIDPKGDWWGIKSSADGKGPGYPLVIFGGDHADVPINAHSGKAVAELVATGNRPYLIDLGGWMVGERTRFFIDFASTLFVMTRGHRWLVIDECHNFAPQGKILDPDAGKMLHWANRLASEGAGKGLILMSASQRPQKIHKDYLTSHETLVAKRVIHPLDRGAVKDWIDGCGDPSKGKEVLDSLAGLQRSQGWVWSPEIGFGPKLVEFPMFGTYDSFAVQTGSASRKLKGWASVDLEEVKAKLAAAVEEAKANDPKALRTELSRVTAELNKLKAADTGKIALEITRAHLREAEKRGFEQAKKKLEAALTRESHQQVLDRMEGMRRIVANTMAQLDKAIGEWKKQKPSLAGHQFDMRFEPSAAPVARVVPQPIPKTAPIRQPLTPSGDGTITPSLQKVLDAIAWWRKIGFEPVKRDRAAVVAGYSPRASTFGVYVAELVKMGMVATAPGTVALTERGFAHSHTPAAAGTEELREMARGLLAPQEARVFDVVYAAYPSEIRRDDVANAVGLSPTASTVGVYIAGVAAYGIIETGSRGAVRAADWLFPQRLAA